MAGEEKNEEPIDPLRAAIMSMSQPGDEEKSALELLREHALAREMEIAATRRQEPPPPEWQPPSEDEFNKEWITPAGAYNLISPLYHGVFGRKWIMTRLKSGLIVAIARNSERGGKLNARAPIPKEFWQTHTDFGDDHFWETGDASFWYMDKKTSCFDVRVRAENLFGEARHRSHSRQSKLRKRRQIYPVQHRLRCQRKTGAADRPSPFGKPF